jgi:hypothetical protein
MIGIWVSLSDAVRSWLRLLTHVKFIRTCYAVDGHLTLLCLCSGVGDFFYFFAYGLVNFTSKSLKYAHSTEIYVGISTQLPGKVKLVEMVRSSPRTPRTTKVSGWALLFGYGLTGRIRVWWRIVVFVAMVIGPVGMEARPPWCHLPQISFVPVDLRGNLYSLTMSTKRRWTREHHQYHSFFSSAHSGRPRLLHRQLLIYLPPRRRHHKGPEPYLTLGTVQVEITTRPEKNYRECPRLLVRHSSSKASCKYLLRGTAQGPWYLQLSPPANTSSKCNRRVKAEISIGTRTNSFLADSQAFRYTPCATVLYFRYRPSLIVTSTTRTSRTRRDTARRTATKTPRTRRTQRKTAIWTVTTAPNTIVTTTLSSETTLPPRTKTLKRTSVDPPNTTPTATRFSRTAIIHRTEIWKRDTMPPRALPARKRGKTVRKTSAQQDEELQTLSRKVGLSSLDDDKASVELDAISKPLPIDCGSSKEGTTPLQQWMQKGMKKAPLISPQPKQGCIKKRSMVQLPSHSSSAPHSPGSLLVLPNITGEITTTLADINEDEEIPSPLRTTGKYRTMPCRTRPPAFRNPIHLFSSVRPRQPCSASHSPI